ncbi:hypothetical protein Vadar_006868 [Vaccinium darrowii]|uniref:Uncharacterized protein n=1 Tax=Vaccinium darrowii TaxID=229202 RepID=A0ACB7YTW9_9ERIC|nr:hypothetical protein Vadar_006868 [Vaccinium darrowii]
MFLSEVFFFLASPFYVKLKAKSSLLTGMFQVILASYKNRHLELSSDAEYHFKKGSMLVVPTEKLRFLNRACVIRDPNEDLTPDGRALDPWSLSTIGQVEELKALIKVMPLWSTGIDIRKPKPELFPRTPSKFHGPPPHSELRNPNRLFWHVSSHFGDPLDCPL